MKVKDVSEFVLPLATLNIARAELVINAHLMAMSHQTTSHSQNRALVLFEATALARITTSIVKHTKRARLSRHIYFWLSADWWRRRNIRRSLQQLDHNNANLRRDRKSRLRRFGAKWDAILDPKRVLVLLSHSKCYKRGSAQVGG